MVAPHPRFPAFFNLLRAEAANLFTAFEGDVFRSTQPVWLSKPYRLTGVGAVLTGGRWNVQNLMTAVCFSANAATTAAEADAKANRYGWTAAEMRPQTRIALHVQLQATLDLTRPAILMAIGLSAADLTGCDWRSDQDDGRESLTQAVGRAVFENLGEGLVAPSARHDGGVNLIYFPSNRREGSLVAAHHESEIPHVRAL